MHLKNCETNLQAKPSLLAYMNKYLNIIEEYFTIPLINDFLVVVIISDP